MKHAKALGTSIGDPDLEDNAYVLNHISLTRDLKALNSGL